MDPKEMNPQNPSPQNPSPQPSTPPPAGPPTAAGPAPQKSWRERSFGLRPVIGVGVAGLLLGALAGAGIGIAAADDDGPQSPPAGPAQGDWSRPGGDENGEHGGYGHHDHPGMPGDHPGMPDDGRTDGQDLPTPPDGQDRPDLPDDQDSQEG
ncbi:hypothetical protein [Nocardioides ochotonae]|uniref:hypothetical protein n=1 Tax=Nocardioides ochotonae TaxID=2685869 RepID=UPI00140C42D8|nr:hypothetical protein [Nocardioides ochotonae]